MIRSHHAQGLSLLRIDRPDKANSLTAAMLRELIAGADLDEARAGLAVSPDWRALSDALADLPALTVAALNGTLAGGAFGMALACDIRLSVRDARFFYPVMRLGFLPQPGDPARLAALVGPARARMILMAGARIEAPEALAWGLVDRLVPADALEEEARALVAGALGADAGHVAAIKAMTRPA